MNSSLRKAVLSTLVLASSTVMALPPSNQSQENGTIDCRAYVQSIKALSEKYKVKEERIFFTLFFMPLFHALVQEDVIKEGTVVTFDQVKLNWMMFQRICKSTTESDEEGLGGEEILYYLMKMIGVKSYEPGQPDTNQGLDAVPQGFRIY